MPRTAALGVVDQETRIALLSLQKRLTVLEKGAFDGRKNLLDNGQFEVNQRALTSASLGSAVLADRWHPANNGVGVLTADWLTKATFGGGNLPADRPTPAHVQRMAVTTGEAAASLSAADYLVYYQSVEGLNLQHLNWGLPSARPVVLSFDVYSTVAGTYAVELLSTQTSATRSISRLFTVTAGAWQTVKLAFPGDTVLGMDNDNIGRLLVEFFVSAGSTYTSGTLQSNWGAATNGNRAVGISNAWQATAGNVWAITNVQLEVGTSATPYEVRSFPDELRTCLRYFERKVSPAATYLLFGPGFNFSTTQSRIYVQCEVAKRAKPSMAYSAASSFAVLNATANIVACTVIATRDSSIYGVDLDTTVAAGLTGGLGTHLYSNGQAATIDFNAEL